MSMQRSYPEHRDFIVLESEATSTRNGFAPFESSSIGPDTETNIALTKDALTQSQPGPYHRQDLINNERQGTIAHSSNDIYPAPTSHEGLDAIFKIAGPMSFCEKTKFLHDAYDSYPNYEAIPLGKLKEISDQLDLSIDEIVSWLGDENIRRSKLLARRTFDQHPSSFQLLPSPNRTSTYGCNNTLNMRIPDNSTISPYSSAQINNTLPIAAPSKAKRGRPRKNRLSARLDSPSPNAKRRRILDKLHYLCPDCTSSLPDDGWLDHVNRRHFPEHIWQCKQLDSATGTSSCSKIFYRSSGFVNHLQAKHKLDEKDIAQLKVVCKLAVVNFFHHICGFLGCNHEPFQTRKDSIEHIRLHFKEVAQQANPPNDLGASQWNHKCACSHELTRGVHYHVTQAENDHDQDDVDDSDNEDDDGGDPGDRSSNQPPRHSDFPPDGGRPPDEDYGSFDDGNKDFDFSNYDFGENSAALNQNSLKMNVDIQSSTYTTYRLEQFVLPFASLRTLGVGGNGLVHEVVDQRSAETFARKSVMRKGKDSVVSLRLFHLKNELLILKELNHPHIVKAMGAYADSDYAHIIISPVADQNLANRLSRSIGQMQLVRWMNALASATSYLHANNIQHLDIKPENILLKKDHILLADFGTAKFFTGFTAKPDEYLALTLIYCAPETMLHGHQQYASDVFSLGCVFSEILTRSSGYSIKQFERFRADHGNKAFYLTVSAVKEWIALLPRCTRCIRAEQQSYQFSKHQWGLHEIICQMLDEEPSARPKASDLHFDLPGTIHCPLHGEIQNNKQNLVLGEQKLVDSISSPSPTANSQFSASATNLLPEARLDSSYEPAGLVHGHDLSGTFSGTDKYFNSLRSGTRDESLQNDKDVLPIIPNKAHFDEERSSAGPTESSLLELLEGAGPPSLRNCALFQDESELQVVQDTKAINLSRSNTGMDHIFKLKILENLEFRGMNDRQEHISKAHEGTFEWVFRNPNDQEKHPLNNFSEWLRSESSIFWIKGKPGSGKSTLMKFITNNQQTRDNLCCWNKTPSLIVASAFLWHGGTALQRSMIGVLRTLLYTTLQNNLDLAPTAFSDRWKSFKSHNRCSDPWSITELIHAFNILISDRTKNFCFFIDGLDEYGGDPTELSDLILSLSTRINVKTCIASRPLVIFQDAFQGQPTLRMQDQTEEDIRLYVEDILYKNKRFAILRDSQPQDAEKTALEVEKKASGVFLWVRLVVQSLLKGLQNYDDIACLQRRLQEIPPDLQALYQEMLNDIQPVYMKQASRLLLLAQTASEPLSLLSLSLAEDGFETAMACDVNPMPSNHISFRIEVLKRQLNTHCRGLLEADEAPPHAVRFLHQTAKDFLERRTIRSKFVAQTHESFDLDIILSGTFLYGIKVMTPSLDMLDYFWASLKKCVDYALRFEDRDKATHISILEELDRTGSVLFETPSFDGTPLIQRILSSRKETQPLGQERELHWTATECLKEGFQSTTRSFFDYAFQYPLHSYIKYRLDNGYHIGSHISGHSLLYKAAIEMVDARMLKILFDYGADPNHSEGIQMPRTPWERMLQQANRAVNEEVAAQNLDALADTFDLFLENGADRQATAGNLPPDVIIKQRFSAWNQGRTKELLEKLSAFQKPRTQQRNQPQLVGSIFSDNTKPKLLPASPAHHQSDGGLSDSSESANDYQLTVEVYGLEETESKIPRKLRALFDTGSPDNFISRSVLDNYKLHPIPPVKVRRYMSLIGSKGTIVPQHFVRLLLSNPTVGLNNVVTLKVFDIPAGKVKLDIILGRRFVRKQNNPFFLSKVVRANTRVSWRPGDIDDRSSVFLGDKTSKSKCTRMKKRETSNANCFETEKEVINRQKENLEQTNGQATHIDLHKKIPGLSSGALTSSKWVDSPVSGNKPASFSYTYVKKSKTAPSEPKRANYPKFKITRDHNNGSIIDLTVEWESQRTYNSCVQSIQKIWALSRLWWSRSSKTILSRETHVPLSAISTTTIPSKDWDATTLLRITLLFQLITMVLACMFSGPVTRVLLGNNHTIPSTNLDVLHAINHGNGSKRNLSEASVFYEHSIDSLGQVGYPCAQILDSYDFTWLIRSKFMILTDIFSWMKPINEFDSFSDELFPDLIESEATINAPVYTSVDLFSTPVVFAENFEALNITHSRRKSKTGALILGGWERKYFESGMRSAKDTQSNPSSGTSWFDIMDEVDTNHQLIATFTPKELLIHYQTHSEDLEGDLNRYISYLILFLYAPESEFQAVLSEVQAILEESRVQYNDDRRKYLD